MKTVKRFIAFIFLSRYGVLLQNELKLNGNVNHFENIEGYIGFSGKQMFFDCFCDYCVKEDKNHFVTVQLSVTLFVNGQPKISPGDFFYQFKSHMPFKSVSFEIVLRSNSMINHDIF